MTSGLACLHERLMVLEELTRDHAEETWWLGGGCLRGCDGDWRRLLGCEGLRGGFDGLGVGFFAGMGWLGRIL